MLSAYRRVVDQPFSTGGGVLGDSAKVDSDAVLLASVSWRGDGGIMPRCCRRGSRPTLRRRKTPNALLPGTGGTLLVERQLDE